MSVTVKDIAEATDLSVAAVIAALGNRGRLAPRTRHRVLDVAQKLGYRPNRAARSMRTRQTGNVAILSSTDHPFSPLHSGVLAGVHDCVSEHNMHTLIARVPDDRLTSKDFVPNVLKELVCDGLLINYHFNVPPRLVELIRHFKIPSVWVNLKRESACVYPDDLGAGRLATEHLRRLGHSRIAFVDLWCSDHYSTTDRYEGYLEVMRNAGLDGKAMSRFTHARVPGHERIARVRHCLAAPDRPTAMLTYGNVYATCVLTAAASLGLTVPDQLSVMSFDSSPIEWGGPPVTTMITPTYSLGRSAAEMILRMIDDPDQVIQPLVVPFEFFEGQTCAQPAPG